MALRTGLDKNTAAALSYVIFFVSGLIIYFVDKDPYVRFHAMQSVVVFGSLIFLNLVFGAIGYMFGAVASLLTILIFILWLTMIYKAWQGDEWEVPFLGKYARKLVK